MIQTQLIDTGDGGLVVNRVQDCEPILERCKSLANSGLKQSDDMKLAASIPAVLVETYLNTNGITFSEFLSNPVHQKRMLNDPALKNFRVWPGRI